MYTYWIL